MIGHGYDGPIYRTTHPSLIDATKDPDERSDRRRDGTLSEQGPLAQPMTPRWEPESKQTIVWETAPDGYRVWMSPGMHEVYELVMDRIRAGRILNASAIARASALSQGYVSKVIRKLALFGFIDLLQSIRGRLGGIVAAVRESWSRKSFLPSRYGGGMISRIRSSKAVSKAETLLVKPWTLDELDL